MAGETRTIRTVLELNASRYVAGAAAASAASKSLSRELGQITKNHSAFQKDWDRTSSALLTGGAAMATGLGLVAKSAMDWESAWAGVLKTVDGTPEQLQAVEDGLRGLTKELPASHAEIAAVAEAAGQLGIETDSVVEFTRTMINLGETTNLSADEAATALARFSNIMGTSQDDIDRVGASLVGLGNNFATTEGEILAMSMRLAGVGAQLGLTEGDVLGLATAMSSVGIEAEAGGTAMTMGMKKIQSAVDEGGESLAGFAEVAGMSSEEFAKLWNEDSAAGLDAFVHGLADAGAEGQNMSAILDDLGIKGIRESDTFLRLAADADGLTDALRLGNDEYAKNIALVAEAEKRYATTESKLKIALNSLVDSGIDLGAVVLPALAGVADGVVSITSAFDQLPASVKTSVTVLGAAAGATGLLAGGLMKVVPAALETIDSFRRIRREAPGVTSVVTKLGLALGSLTVASAIVLPHVSTGEVTSMDEYAAALMRIADGQTVEGVSQLNGYLSDSDWFAGLDVKGLGDVYSIITDPTFAQSADNVVSSILSLGQRGSSDMEFANREWAKLDQTIAAMASSGDLEQVDTLLKAISDEIYARTGERPTIEQLRDALPETNGALELVAATAETAGGAQGEFADATGDATGEVEDQSEALRELQDLLQGTADILLSTRSATREWEAALDDAQAALKENGKTLDTSTEKGRANEAALDGIASSTLALLDSQVELGASTEELDATMEEGRKRFIDMAVAMGMPREEAESLANELQLIPGTYTAEIEVQGAWEATIAAAEAAITSMTAEPHTVTVDADTIPAEESVYGFEAVMDGATAPRDVVVSADTTWGEDELRKFESQIQESGGTVEINGETLNGQQALDVLIEEINNGEGYVVINGTPTTAYSALAQLTDVINASGGVVKIDGNNAPALGATDRAVGHADSSTGTIDVDASTGGAERDISRTARDRDADITARARTGGAEAALDAVARARTAIINVVTSVSGRAEGGWVTPGLSAGGWVPGPYPGPGVDNIMWPLAGKAGGGMLTQPLAGTEFVVNGESSRQWGPALEAINSGLTPKDLAAAMSTTIRGGVTYAPSFTGLDAAEAAVEFDARARHLIRDQAITM
ncbi:phage tail tape measure protein [Brachybacterium hainanense]|uniref:Phage tail tape measure protein n=1 Tax=Brachybacterium hainanense TaxID=1541174 RepID=A0ABV6R987_9MICO